MMSAPAVEPALPRTLVVANVAGAALSTASALVGLARPGVVLAAGAPVTAGVHFYAAAYAARALPLGVVLIHRLLADRAGRGLLPVLLLAGAVQAGDLAVGLSVHNPGMTLGAGALAVLHLASALRVARADAGPSAHLAARRAARPAGSRAGGTR
ncbi:hypothetical protein [Kitasatospora paranensis]|uniref:Uncharacterized protein n=1 Tax=Kitasatospora paranensis TaxID=258053 RepID=A0ABW2G6H7_9ACTN